MRASLKVRFDLYSYLPAKSNPEMSHLPSDAHLVKATCGQKRAQQIIGPPHNPNPDPKPKPNLNPN